MDIHVHVHEVPDGDTSERLARVEALLRAVLAKLTIIDTKGSAIMLDLTALTAEVADNGDVIASASTLLSSLSQQIRDMAGDPAAIAALADQLDANSAALADAVAANTPAASGTTPDDGEPAPTPEPPA